MNAFQRKRFETLLRLASDPAYFDIAREYVSRAFGYIDGLLEGDAITPTDYAGFFREISAAESTIRERSYRRIGLAS